MNIEGSSICRLCLEICQNFTKIEQAHCKPLNMHLPFLNLTITKDPVMCKSCFKLTEKYLTCKATTLNTKTSVKDWVKNTCLFCIKPISDSTVCLNSHDIDVLLLRTMMEQYFPELELQLRADLFNICSVCYEDLQEVLGFLTNLRNLEERIEEFYQKVGVFNKGVDLRDVIRYKKEIEETPELDTNIVKLESTEYIKQEPTEDEFIKLENKNTGTHSIDSKPIEIVTNTNKVKIKNETIDNQDTNINTYNEKFKTELCLEQESIDIKSVNDDDTDFDHENIETISDEIISHKNYHTEFSNEQNFVSPSNHIEDSMKTVEKKSSYKNCLLTTNGDRRNESTGDRIRDSIERVVRNSSNKTEFDHIQESIERVVRKWANYEPAKSENKLSEESKSKVETSTANENKTKVSPRPLPDDVKAKMLQKRHWWKKTAVINRPTPQYYSKTELRAMISRIRVSGERKFQCQVCKFIVRAKCSMNRHMILHQNPSERDTFYCYNCKFKTHRKGDLPNHMVTHRDPSQKPVFKCKHCQFSTKKRFTLRQHMLTHNIATGAGMLECYTCGFKTSEKTTLVDHISIHRSKAEVLKRYKCEKCSQVSSVEAEPKIHLCEYCGYESKHAESIASHMEGV